MGCRGNIPQWVDQDILSTVCVWTKDRNRPEAKLDQLARLIREVVKAEGIR